MIMIDYIYLWCQRHCGTRSFQSCILKSYWHQTYLVQRFLFGWIKGFPSVDLSSIFSNGKEFLWRAGLWEAFFIILSSFRFILWFSVDLWQMFLCLWSNVVGVLTWLSRHSKLLFISSIQHQKAATPWICYREVSEWQQEQMENHISDVHL